MQDLTEAKSNPKTFRQYKKVKGTLKGMLKKRDSELVGVSARQLQRTKRRTTDCR